jgi:hypothetical protein
MIASTSYADAFFGVPGGVYRMDARRLGAGYADGAPVQYASDLLGRGRAVQDTLASRPLFEKSKTALEFTGTQWMLCPQATRFSPLSDFTVYVVFHFVSGDATRVLVGQGGTDTSTRNYWLCTSTSGRLSLFTAASFFATPNNTIPTGNDYAVSLTSKSGVLTVHIDDTLAITASRMTENTAPVPPIIGARYGADLSSVISNLISDMYSVSFFRTAHSDQQRAFVFTALKRQWGLS